MMLSRELLARLIGVCIVVGLLGGVGVARWLSVGQSVTIHARMPEQGGWVPADVSVAAGEELILRLTSDDVMHGFAIGQSDRPPVDVSPGQVVEVRLSFDQPGKYTFYCTRWCGPNHWRMRGTIEVTGAGESAPAKPALYLTLGIDLDQPHPAAELPAGMPSVVRGAELSSSLPTDYLNTDYYLSHSPAVAFLDLREQPFSSTLSDAQVWDLVAYIWQSNTSLVDLQEGQQLYAANCAACHGVQGAGDGVMADQLAGEGMDMSASGESGISGHETVAPTDFTEANLMLGASPALLQGKIVRGGMGTGMPYWGPIFTDEQTWALVAYLWSFQFEYEWSLP